MREEIPLVRHVLRAAIRSMPSHATGSPRRWGCAPGLSKGARQQLTEIRDPFTAPQAKAGILLEHMASGRLPW